MSERKVTEMSREELVEAIFTEAYGVADARYPRYFHCDTTAEIHDWLSSVCFRKNETVEALAEDWLHYYHDPDEE